jgi:hypothetical protein
MNRSVVRRTGLDVGRIYFLYQTGTELRSQSLYWLSYHRLFKCLQTSLQLGPMWKVLIYNIRLFIGHSVQNRYTSIGCNMCLLEDEIAQSVRRLNYEQDDRWIGVQFRSGQQIFLRTASSQALLPIQIPMQPGSELFPGVKQPRREADESFPFSAEVRNAWNYISTLPYALMAWRVI